MRVLACAILSAALALSLASPSAVAEVTVNVIDLRRACMAPREFAMVEMFGADYTPEQASILDGRLEQELSGKTPQALADAYQAFERNPQSRRPDADRYAQCIYGERLRQLDPSADLQAVRRGDYTPPSVTPDANSPWNAALTRTDRNASAGSAVLAQSADPASRAARARENAMLREQAEQRIAQRRAENEAFWGAVLQAATIAAQTYVAVEQAQAEADAAAAQARADAYAQAQQTQAAQQQQQQAAAGYPVSGAGGNGGSNYASSRPVSPGGGPCARLEPTGHSFPVGANAGQYERYDYRLVNGCGVPVVFTIEFASGSTRDVTVTGASRDWLCTVGFLGNTDCVGGISRWGYR